MLCYVVVLLQLFVRIASESSLYRQRPLWYVEAPITSRFLLPITSI